MSHTHKDFDENLEKKLWQIDKKMPGVYSTLSYQNYSSSDGHTSEVRKTEDVQFAQNKSYKVLAELVFENSENMWVSHYDIDHRDDQSISDNNITLYINDKAQPNLRGFFVERLDMSKPKGKTESQEFKIQLEGNKANISYQGRVYKVNLKKVIDEC